jgi:hypothetical protein
MIHSIHINEWLQVLVLVCLPLVFLLSAVIILLRRGRGKVVVFPGFSVTISIVGRNEAYVTYQGNSTQLEFSTEIGRGKKMFSSRVALEVPKEVPDEDVREIVPQLALALAKLHYEYLVFRKREFQTIPDAERESAIAELRQMGCEIKEPVGHGQVQHAVVNDWRGFSAEQTQGRIARLQDLLGKAREVRQSIEVLASSDAGP